MKIIISIIKKILKFEEGATMVEYGFLLAFIAIIVAVALTTFGPAVGDLYTEAVNSF